MSGWWVVFVKEVVDNLRDRRAVMSSLIFGPLFGPVLFAVMISTVANIEVEKTGSPLQIPVVGEQNAPNLVDFLRRQGVAIKPAPADPEQAVSGKDEDVVLRIPAAYAEQWREGRPAMVELIVDKSRRETGKVYDRVARLLNTYGGQIGALRLQLRGVHPGIAQAIGVREVDLSTPGSRGALILGMLPFFIMYTVFIGGMYLAIDATAGEKERQSLEPLLINPAPRWQIMMGKLTATFVFSLLTLVVALVAFYFSKEMIPAASLNIRFHLSPVVLGWCFLLLVPVALVASGLQTIIAAFAKGFREAQTYLSLLMLAPMLPTMWLFLSPVKEQDWMAAVPLLAQSVLINNLIRGEEINLQWAAVSTFVAMLLGGALCLVAARLYHRPRMVFSKA